MNAERKTIVGIGEILWDVFDTGKTLGGAPANFAYHAAQAGANGVVVSAIGNDALGDEIVRALDEKNLHAHLQRNDHATGTVCVSLDADGVARYHFPPDVAWDNLEFTESLCGLAQTTHAAAFGTLAQRAPRSRETIRAFLNAMPENALRVCDINLRQNFYSEPLIRESIEIADLLKLNEDELAVLGRFFSDEKSDALSDRCKSFFQNAFKAFERLKYIVLTCGADGSFAATRDGEHSFVPADKTVRVVDTVGAGDSFTATFTVALLEGESLPQAHRRAATRADFVCSRPGAMCDKV